MEREAQSSFVVAIGDHCQIREVIRGRLGIHRRLPIQYRFISLTCGCCAEVMQKGELGPIIEAFELFGLDASLKDEFSIASPYPFFASERD